MIYKTYIIYQLIVLITCIYLAVSEPTQNEEFWVIY